ncbi:hypothetical protein TGDOM2_400120 [Toxoplasma gondii GAB2-2007-GAL-DOM2]|uniref:Uncharacterized protein n=1 Tax=Toxoplasma gondii GAB2-2007-GAL-DOM2 TaxID=1130820 RepID=A0A086JVM5_TOXGO|nr:hypothetical protein TGDOM2_400120 [Toxoplasma gondii GAB2-2007-GAL-DOM2]
MLEKRRLRRLDLHYVHEYFSTCGVWEHFSDETFQRQHFDSSGAFDESANLYSLPTSFRRMSTRTLFISVVRILETLSLRSCSIVYRKQTYGLQVNTCSPQLTV